MAGFSLATFPLPPQAESRIAAEITENTAPFDRIANSENGAFVAAQCFASDRENYTKCEGAITRTRTTELIKFATGPPSPMPVDKAADFTRAIVSLRSVHEHHVRRREQVQFGLDVRSPQSAVHHTAKRGVVRLPMEGGNRAVRSLLRWSASR